MIFLSVQARSPVIKQDYTPQLLFGLNAFLFYRLSFGANQWLNPPFCSFIAQTINFFKKITLNRIGVNPINWSTQF